MLFKMLFMGLSTAKPPPKSAKIYQKCTFDMGGYP